MALPRLKRRREFLRVAERGKRIGRPGLVLQALGGTGEAAARRLHRHAEAGRGGGAQPYQAPAARGRPPCADGSAAGVGSGADRAGSHSHPPFCRSAGRSAQCPFGPWRNGLGTSIMSTTAQSLAAGAAAARGGACLSLDACPRARLQLSLSPSCSAYALEALARHGAARGSLLAARRILRCNPWNPGGYDPVPPPRGRE